MTLKTAFAETEITPPLGTHKIGWLKDIVSDVLLDPLFSRAMVLESDEEQIAFIQLDTLCIRWTQVKDIRNRIERRYGFPGHRIMVAATHNHAGPAVANAGVVARDDPYVEILVSKVVDLFGICLEKMSQAEIGFGSCFDFDVAHNRRVIMRDGTVKTHGTFDDPDALCLEGPIDPEVAVLAARDGGGRLLGAMVNYACHPTHHGGETTLSAGYPGVICQVMKELGCPVTLFLNGASGNVHTADPARGGRDLSKEEAGRILAEDAWKVIGSMAFRNEVRLGGASRTIDLPFRAVTKEEVAGTVRGAQRFVDSTIYDRIIPGLVTKIQAGARQQAEVQVLFIDEQHFVGIPAEYFVQHGLRIKEDSFPRRARIVGHANGMVGYVPHRDAFRRGGYETTFCSSSKLAPEAGDLFADCAIDLIRSH